MAPLFSGSLPLPGWSLLAKSAITHFLHPTPHRLRNAMSEASCYISPQRLWNPPLRSTTSMVEQQERILLRLFCLLRTTSSPRPRTRMLISHAVAFRGTSPWPSAVLVLTISTTLEAKCVGRAKGLICQWSLQAWCSFEYFYVVLFILCLDIALSLALSCFYLSSTLRYHGCSRLRTLREGAGAGCIR